MSIKNFVVAAFFCAGMASGTVAQSQSVTPEECGEKGCTVLMYSNTGGLPHQQVASVKDCGKVIGANGALATQLDHSVVGTCIDNETKRSLVSYNCKPNTDYVVKISKCSIEHPYRYNIQ
jgi:hypothetical protein